MAEIASEVPLNGNKNIVDQFNSLSKKLKEKNQQYPKLNFSNASQTAKIKKKQKLYVQQNKSIEYEAKNKQSVIWNNSAQAWTRQTSPSHSIPKSKRFSEPRPFFHASNCPQLFVNLRTKIVGEDKGVSFAKSERPNLFTIQPNPSPSQYDPKRYLQNSCFSSQISRQKYNSKISNLRNNPQNQLSQAFYHIKGGTMNRFGNYQLLYYPHTKKMNYNQKIITEQMQRKCLNLSMKQKSFRIKKSSYIFNGSETKESGSP